VDPFLFGTARGDNLAEREVIALIGFCTPFAVATCRHDLLLAAITLSCHLLP
jgi:hypothetical protein